MPHIFNSTRLRALLLVSFLTVFAACSDDTSAQKNAAQCEENEHYNELNGRCEVSGPGDGRPGTNNSNGENNDSSDASTNNDSADAGTDAGPADTGTDTDPDDTGTPDDGMSQPDADAASDGGDNGPDTVTPECGPGTIIGKACAPSGAVLAGATVTLEGFDCDGQPYNVTTQANADGDYEFNDVPAGRHTVTVATGSFSGSQQVRVYTGQTTDLSSDAKVCLDAANVEIAVIQGSYDKVEELLDDLQISYDIKGSDGGGGLFPSAPSNTIAFLSDLNAMNQYDIIFINCGQLWNALQTYAPESVSTIISNLVAYLNAGHSLYTSDWAHAFVETAFPDMVDFYGDDATTSEALYGYAPQSINARVLSPELQNTLGHNTTTIDFPHDPPQVLNNNWAVAEGVGPEATVHLQGDIQLCGSTSCGAGGPTITEAPLLVSHVTPGGGTVFFTSFHNESQGGINQDMEAILRFLIFQL